MPKKPRVRTLMDSEHVKGSERLLKYAGKYFSHLFWSLWKYIILKNSFFVLYEILRLLVNILTPNDKCSLSVKRITDATNSNAFISKSKIICWIFCCISGIEMNVEILWKKRWASQVISFWNYRRDKARLLKCLKGCVPENFWTIIILKCQKDCLNVDGSIFVILFHISERKSAWKILF